MMNVAGCNKETEEACEGKADSRKRLTGVMCGVIMPTATIWDCGCSSARLVPTGALIGGYAETASTLLFWRPMVDGRKNSSVESRRGMAAIGCCCGQ